MGVLSQLARHDAAVVDGFAAGYAYGMRVKTAFPSALEKAENELSGHNYSQEKVDPLEKQEVLRTFETMRDHARA